MVLSAPDRLGDMARKGAKALFAATDFLLGPWPGPRILIYHEVSERPKRQMEVSSSIFRSQLEWLQGTGRVVDLDTALRARGQEAAERLYVLTFDDGYQGVYSRAFPLLAHHGAPFTLYLATESLESGRSASPGLAPLTWSQVGEMVASGLVTVGAHTHRHRELRGLPQLEIAGELERSDELIEERIGHRPRHFAYPKGFWDSTAEVLVRRRYSSAVLGAGPPLTAGTDPYRIHRLPVQRADGLLFFRRKVLKGMRLEEALRRRLKGYGSPP